jgi:hypothetical protein
MAMVLVLGLHRPDTPRASGVQPPEAIVAKGETIAGRHTESAPSRLCRQPCGFDDGAKLLEAAERHGLEGIVSKRFRSAYRSGPSRDWVKIKTAAWRAANRERWRVFQGPRLDGRSTGARPRVWLIPDIAGRHPFSLTFAVQHALLRTPPLPTQPGATERCDARVTLSVRAPRFSVRWEEPSSRSPPPRKSIGATNACCGRCHHARSVIRPLPALRVSCMLVGNRGFRRGSEGDGVGAKWRGPSPG